MQKAQRLVLFLKIKKWQQASANTSVNTQKHANLKSLLADYQLRLMMADDAAMVADGRIRHSPPAAVCRINRPLSPQFTRTWTRAPVSLQGNHMLNPEVISSASFSNP